MFCLLVNSRGLAGLESSSLVKAGSCSLFPTDLIHAATFTILAANVVYADFLIIGAVNLSLMTHARPQNTYYQLSDCMQTVQFHIRQLCSADSIWSPFIAYSNPTPITASGKQAQEVSSVSYVIPV